MSGPSPRSLLVLACVLGCGAKAPARSTAPAAPAATQAAAAPSATANERTEEQKRRDAARTPLAEAVVDAYPNWNGFFSSLVARYAPDNKRFLFGSVRDGIPQIYEGDLARRADPPRAVTSGAERAIWARYTLDGKFILYLRDTKGDEMHHVYRVNADGAGLVDLTPGEAMRRGEPELPRKKPDLMFYDGARLTDPATLVFSQKISGGEPKLVYTGPGPGGLAAVTSDGARFLVVDVHAGFADIVLSEVETASGATRRVYPPEGKKVTLSGIAYSPDDSRIYVGTDEGVESSVIVALDAKTGKELARYASDAPKAAPLGFVVSPQGDRLAVDVGAGDHGEVRILDAKTLKLQRAVKVPLAEVKVGTFRPDGKEFSLLLSQPDHPADVYAVDAASGEVHPLRDDKRPGIDTLPPIEATIEKVKAFDSLTIPVNRDLPQGAGAKKLPTIVIFHGGPASSYQVRWSPYARFFLSLGYAVLEPNVRGSTGFGRAYEMADNREKRADWLKDLETINAWTKSRPFCDPERVVVWGQSYGGYTTLMALTRQPKLWRAGVDLYGVADLKQFLRTTEAAIRTVFVSEFGDLEKDGPLLDEFSPMRDVDKIVAPLFVYSGKNDPRVPPTEAETIVRALRGRAVPVEFMLAANEGHTVDRRETKIELLTRTARFLEDALAAH
jgi:dipeptidyl aminopeptidase/acylaminoacyl peptidase